jgi:hypothetical protein
MLTNRRVLAVDQDGIDARRIENGHSAQVFVKRESSGAVIVGMFNTSTGTSAAPGRISVTAAQLGLGAGRHPEKVMDLWTGQSSEMSAGAKLSRLVAPEGVSFLEITPGN